MKREPHLYADMDILIYRVGWGCKGYDLTETCRTMDQNIYKIIERFNIPYTLVISNTEKTFRHDVAVTAPYKGTRKQEKPEFYHELRRYLVERWDAVMSPVGLEADDFIGIHCTRKDIIATIDKDLLMIPAAYHYNFVKDTVTKVKRNMYYFWHQLLTGDKADNIIGLKGIGEVKADRILKGVKLKDMKNVVFQKYEEEFKDRAQERFRENCALLWILRDQRKDFTHYI